MALCDVTSVGTENLSGDEGRLVGSKKVYGAGDLLGAAQAHQRRIFGKLPQIVAAEMRVHLRVDHPGLGELLGQLGAGVDLLDLGDLGLGSRDGYRVVRHRGASGFAR